MESGAGAEGRRHLRIRYDTASVTVRYVKSGPSIPAKLLDIGERGCRLAVAESLPVSVSEVIEVRLDLNSLVLRVLGFVRHADEAARAVGIEFHCLSAADQCDLESFVRYFAPINAS
jgi:hypothetical protein